MKTLATLSLVCIVTASPVLACAKDRAMGPPEEAFAACSGIAENDSCQFTGRRDDTLRGQCRIMREQRLVCVPENHPHRGKGPMGDQQ